MEKNTGKLFTPVHGTPMDYLRWRGDLTFRQDGFNEVDNLVLCIISYINFRRIDADCELAVYSTEPRALIFHTALLAPKTTRTTQGVAVMTLKPKYQLETVKALEDTPITNQSRYRVRSLPAAGALLREEDSEERQMDLLD